MRNIRGALPAWPQRLCGGAEPAYGVAALFAPAGGIGGRGAGSGRYGRYYISRVRRIAGGFPAGRYRAYPVAIGPRRAQSDRPFRAGMSVLCARPALVPGYTLNPVEPAIGESSWILSEDCVMIPCGTAVRILIPKDGAMIRGTQSNPRRSMSLGHPVMRVVRSRRGSSRSALDAAGKTADASLGAALARNFNNKYGR